MANIGKKTSSNVFYLARSEASKHNDTLSSRESAADLMGIDRGRLFRIENGVVNPYPEEVVLMADLYGAPELYNYYCTKICPLGIDVPAINPKADIYEITVNAMVGFRKAGEVQNILLDVCNSKNLSNSDMKKLDSAIAILKEIGKVYEELSVWKKKNM